MYFIFEKILVLENFSTRFKIMSLNNSYIQIILENLPKYSVEENEKQVVLFGGDVFANEHLGVLVVQPCLRQRKALVVVVEVHARLFAV